MTKKWKKKRKSMVETKDRKIERKNKRKTKKCIRECRAFNGMSKDL